MKVSFKISRNWMDRFSIMPWEYDFDYDGDIPKLEQAIMDSIRDLVGKFAKSQKSEVKE